MPFMKGKEGRYMITSEEYIEHKSRQEEFKIYHSIDEVPEADREKVRQHLKQTVKLENGDIVVKSPTCIEYWGFGGPLSIFISVDDIPQEHKNLVSKKLEELGYATQGGNKYDPFNNIRRARQEDNKKPRAC